MKKLLILSLVLGVASMASAGWYYTTDAPADALVGDDITVDIYIGSSVPADVLTNPHVAVTNGTVTGATLATGVWTEGTTPVLTFDAGGVLVSNAVISTGIPTGTLLLSIDITADVAGTLIVDADSGTWSGFDAVPGNDASEAYLGSYPDDGGLPYAEVTVTPEPATMALLGLGALVLRRKK